MIGKGTFYILTLNLVTVLAQDVLVTIPDGTLKGRQEYSLRGISFYAFQQIPYGKPPIGELRFKEPQAAEKWEGTLEATVNTKICYQRSNLYNVGDLAALETEDCLYLNVYTPQYPTASTDYLLPVMVYIYGGGFINGAANFDFFGPHYLMENDVIVVTLNYRVGPFGFLSTGDTVIPGNFGLKDQILALQWVKNNIQYFGGDPGKVTIFGQSAGAASVAYLIQSPKAEGLFRAAICQSGSNLSPWSYQRDHTSIAYQLASYVDSTFNTDSTSEELLEFLRGVPAEKINNASLQFHASYGNEEIVQGFFFAVAIEPEHENAVITEEMYGVIEAGKMKNVPLLIGICSEEAIARAADLDNFKTVCNRYDSAVGRLVNKNMHVTDQDELTAIGEEIRQIYTDGLFEDNPGPALEYFSDMSFGRAVIHHAKLQSQFSDVYFYQFSYHGSLGGNRPNVDGAYMVGHSEDNKYLWVSANHSYLSNYPENDILTSDRFRALFTNFAKELNPTPEATDLFQNLIWPKVTTDNFQYLDINETLSIQKDPKGDAYGKWVRLYEEKAIQPYDTF